MRALAFALIGMATIAAPVAAQDTSADATYGEVTLSSGFTPDPYRVSMQSGGSVAASNISGSCAGFIANAPDFRLYYNSGSLPLILSANSNSDTTLVVNGPDGSWYCDDDGGQGTNPSIRIEKPQGGRYEIWVGTYGSSQLQAATLSISELYSE